MTKIEQVQSPTKDQLVELVTRYKTNIGILRSLGISSDPRIKRVLNNLFDQYNIDRPITRRRKEYTDQDIVIAAQTATCLSDVLDKLGLAKHGSNYSTIRKNISRLNIDISHLSTKEGRIKNRNQHGWTVENIFVQESKIGRGNLRGYVLKYGVLKSYHCKLCDNKGVWNGKQLSLTIDHINGINNDNRIENLRWLCPNCHSQTETFGTRTRI